MSHDEYIVGFDEEQLESLIERAKAKLKQIRETGWVKVWVVSDDDLNRGWFSLDDREGALAFLTREVERQASYGILDGIQLRKKRYRPDEALQLIEETKRETKSSSVAR